MEHFLWETNLKEIVENKWETTTYVNVFSYF